MDHGVWRPARLSGRKWLLRIATILKRGATAAALARTLAALEAALATLVDAITIEDAAGYFCACLYLR